MTASSAGMSPRKQDTESRVSSALYRKTVNVIDVRVRPDSSRGSAPRVHVTHLRRVHHDPRDDRHGTEGLGTRQARAASAAAGVRAVAGHPTPRPIADRSAARDDGSLPRRAGVPPLRSPNRGYLNSTGPSLGSPHPHQESQRARFDSNPVPRRPWPPCWFRPQAPPRPDRRRLPRDRTSCWGPGRASATNEPRFLFGAQFALPVANRFDIYPSFDYYFPGNNVKVWSLDGTMRYWPKLHMQNSGLYVGGGLNISHVSVDVNTPFGNFSAIQHRGGSIGAQRLGLQEGQAAAVRAAQAGDRQCRPPGHRRRGQLQAVIAADEW